MGILIYDNMDLDSVPTDKAPCGIKEMGKSAAGLIGIKRLKYMHRRF
jgi:hypothetical protein